MVSLIKQYIALYFYRPRHLLVSTLTPTLSLPLFLLYIFDFLLLPLSKNQKLNVNKKAQAKRKN